MKSYQVVSSRIKLYEAISNSLPDSFHGCTGFGSSRRKLTKLELKSYEVVLSHKKSNQVVSSHKKSYVL
jgi:hypothetical protein